MNERDSLQNNWVRRDGGPYAGSSSSVFFSRISQIYVHVTRCCEIQRQCSLGWWIAFLVAFPLVCLPSSMDFFAFFDNLSWYPWIIYQHYPITFSVIFSSVIDLTHKDAYNFLSSFNNSWPLSASKPYIQMILRRKAVSMKLLHLLNAVVRFLALIGEWMFTELLISDVTKYICTLTRLL